MYQPRHSPSRSFSGSRDRNIVHRDDNSPLRHRFDNKFAENFSGQFQSIPEEQYMTRSRTQKNLDFEHETSSSNTMSFRGTHHNINPYPFAKRNAQFDELREQKQKGSIHRHSKEGKNFTVTHEETKKATATAESKEKPASSKKEEDPAETNKSQSLEQYDKVVTLRNISESESDSPAK